MSNGKKTDNDGSIHTEQDVNVECMGCKAVAFTTPLVVSGYIVSLLNTREKIEAVLPLAKTWKGRDRWRYQLFRFGVVYFLPLSKPGPFTFQPVFFFKEFID